MFGGCAKSLVYKPVLINGMGNLRSLCADLVKGCVQECRSDPGQGQIIVSSLRQLLPGCETR